MKIEILYIGGAIAVLTLSIVSVYAFKWKRKINHILDTKTIRAEDIRLRKKESVPRRVHTLDSTKRKTLQPGNEKIVPMGWETIEAKQPDVLVDIIPTARGAVQYKFYGSALCLKDKVLVSGLLKKMHKLEITAKDEMYIDNETHTLHIDDIKMLKRYIFEVQGKA